MRNPSLTEYLISKPEPDPSPLILGPFQLYFEASKALGTRIEIWIHVS